MFDNDLIKQLALICVNKEELSGIALNHEEVYNRFKKAYEDIEAAYNEDARENT